MDKYKLLISDSYNGSMSDFRAMCRKYIEEEGVKLIIIDELQTMIPNTIAFNSYALEISYISKALKAITRNFNVCVVATS